jgi:hypothetical protein
MSAINVKTATFTGSATSDVVDLGAEAVMQIRTPDSFTATTITVEGQNADGDYETIKIVDSSLTANDFTITVDGTTGYAYDVTAVFPAGSRKVRFVASASITDAIEVITRRVD